MSREFATALARLNDGSVRKLIFDDVEMGYGDGLWLEEMDGVSLRMFPGEL